MLIPSQNYLHTASKIVFDGISGNANLTLLLHTFNIIAAYCWAASVSETSICVCWQISASVHIPGEDLLDLFVREGRWTHETLVLWVALLCVGQMSSERIVIPITYFFFKLVSRQNNPSVWLQWNGTTKLAQASVVPHTLSPPIFPHHIPLKSCHIWWNNAPNVALLW